MREPATVSSVPGLLLLCHELCQQYLTVLVLVLVLLLADYRCDSVLLDKRTDGYIILDGASEIPNYAASTVKDFGTAVEYRPGLHRCSVSNANLNETIYFSLRRCEGTKKFSEGDGAANSVDVPCDATARDFVYPPSWNTCVDEKPCPDPSLPAEMTAADSGPYKATGPLGDTFTYI